MATLRSRIKTGLLNLASAVDAKPFKGATEELGYARRATIGWYPDEEKNPDDLSIDDYVKMLENDGQVAGVTRLLQYPVISAPWDIIPADTDNGEADFIRHIFTAPPHMGGMSIPMEDVIADMTRAFVEGFRLFEEVFYIIPVGEYKGFYGLQKLAPRDAATIWMKSDEHGNFDGARQRVFFKTKYDIVDLPKEKLVLYTFQSHKNALYGQSVLKAAYYHYDKKHKVYWILHKAAEVSAIPPKVINLKTNPSPAQLTALETAVDTLGVNARVTIPVGMAEVIPYESRKGGELVNGIELVNEHNNQISKSVLAQFIDMGAVTAKTGSRSMSQDHSELFLKALQGEMRRMAMTFNNSVIPQLIDWNFGTTNYPRFEFKDITDEAGMLVKEAIKGIFSSPKDLPSQFVNGALARMAEEMQIEYDEQAGLEELTGQAEADAAASGAPAYQDATGPTPAADGSQEPDATETKMSSDQRRVLQLAQTAFERTKIKTADELGVMAPRTTKDALTWLKDSVRALPVDPDEEIDQLVLEASERGRQLTLGSQTKLLKTAA